MNIRILHVITSLRTGGAEKMVSELAPLLKKKGYEVDVCAFDGAQTYLKKSLEDAGVRVITFALDCNVYNPLFIFRLCHLMKNYDIVHTHNTAPQLFAALCSLVCHVRTVTTEHNTSNRRRHWKWYVAVDRWMYKRYDKVICISERARENLLESHPSLTNVCTVYNGIDIDRFHSAKSIDNMKTAGVTVVAMVAGFRHQKDQDTLIRAIASLDRSKFELWLIGEGERRPILESLTKKLGVDDIVKFLGVRFDIAQLLHTADIIVMSSHFEGLSLSNLEGMSAGKPFIASDVDGLREVTEGYGILFPRGDYKALASELQHLAEDGNYYQQVAEKCLERSRIFDIQGTLNGYRLIYEDMMKGTSNGR